LIQVNLQEAKTQFLKLIEKVMAGEEIIISKDNTPVAKLVQFTTSKQKRKLGLAQGTIQISADFNGPLNEFKEYMF
jgi:prevent-host-death family protein